MIKLHEIKTPVVEFELSPGGEVRAYDPFEIARRVEPRITPDLKLSEIISILREALALSVDQASDFKIIWINRHLCDFVAEQMASKSAPPVQQT